MKAQTAQEKIMGWFILGFFIGGNFGVLIATLCVTSKQEND